MKTSPTNQWLDKFRLVQVTRRMEEDIRLHSEQCAALHNQADWDTACVDWTIHSAHDFFANHVEPL